jgi:hypothetical protein
MSQSAQTYQRQASGETQPYTRAGWLAIIGAILFPVGFGVAVFTAVISAKAFSYQGPIIGPADFIFWIQIACVVYALYMFRRYLNERYEYREINTLIMASILWSIVFTVIGFVLKLMMIVLGIENEPAGTVLMLGFMAVAMITIGVIDIMIATRLLRDKARFTDMIGVFAYVTMVAGICEVSLILLPLSLLLVPVTCVILGIILLRANEEAEFV